jgi:hypothetical protein
MISEKFIAMFQIMLNRKCRIELLTIDTDGITFKIGIQNIDGFVIKTVTYERMFNSDTKDLAIKIIYDACKEILK